MDSPNITLFNYLFIYIYIYTGQVMSSTRGGNSNANPCNKPIRPSWGSGAGAMIGVCIYYILYISLSFLNNPLNNHNNLNADSLSLTHTLCVYRRWVPGRSVHKIRTRTITSRSNKPSTVKAAGRSEPMNPSLSRHVHQGYQGCQGYQGYSIYLSSYLSVTV